jgi:hypothetical protein
MVVLSRFSACVVVLVGAGACGRFGFDAPRSGAGGVDGSSGTSDTVGAIADASPDAWSCNLLADVNANATPDCTENVIGYGQFTMDVQPWAASTTATINWSPMDALGSASSGSGLLVDIVATTTANGGSIPSACIPVVTNRNYGVYTSYWMASGQPGGDASAATWITIDVYSDNACANPSATISGGLLGTTKNAWATYYRGLAAGSIGRSIRLELGVIKGATTSPVSAYFDDVLLVLE